MIDWLSPIFGVIAFLSMLIFIFLIFSVEHGALHPFVLVFSCLVFIGSASGYICLCLESERFYRESCFLYMAETPPVQWNYSNKDWKLVRINNDEIYLLHDYVQYKVTVVEDGGFYIFGCSDGKIKYAVSQNGDITSFSAR